MRSVVATSEIWRGLLAGERPPIKVNEPQPGYYRRRLVKDGPFVPCRIWVEEERDEAGDLIADQKFFCLVNGRAADAFDQWSWLASHPISEADYEFMTEDADWCRKYAPDDPKANPTKPIKARTTKPVLPPRRSE